MSDAPTIEATKDYALPDMQGAKNVMGTIVPVLGAMIHIMPEADVAKPMMLLPSVHHPVSKKDFPIPGKEAQYVINADPADLKFGCVLTPSEKTAPGAPKFIDAGAAVAEMYLPFLKGYNAQSKANTKYTPAEIAYQAMEKRLLAASRAKAVKEYDANVASLAATIKATTGANFTPDALIASARVQLDAVQKQTEADALKRSSIPSAANDNTPFPYLLPAASKATFPRSVSGNLLLGLGLQKPKMIRDAAFEVVQLPPPAITSSIVMYTEKPEPHPAEKAVVILVRAPGNPAYAGMVFAVVMTPFFYNTLLNLDDDTRRVFVHRFASNVGLAVPIAPADIDHIRFRTVDKTVYPKFPKSGLLDAPPSAESIAVYNSLVDQKMAANAKAAATATATAAAAPAAASSSSSAAAAAAAAAAVAEKAVKAPKMSTAAAAAAAMDVIGMPPKTAAAPKSIEAPVLPSTPTRKAPSAALAAAQASDNVVSLVTPPKAPIATAAAAAPATPGKPAKPAAAVASPKAASTRRKRIDDSDDVASADAGSETLLPAATAAAAAAPKTPTRTSAGPRTKKPKVTAEAPAASAPAAAAAAAAVAAPTSTPVAPSRATVDSGAASAAAAAAAATDAADFAAATKLVMAQSGLVSSQASQVAELIATQMLALQTQETALDIQLECTAASMKRTVDSVNAMQKEHEVLQSAHSRLIELKKKNAAALDAAKKK
jgi:hypothetical protein